MRRLDLGGNATFATDWLKPIADMTELTELRLAMIGFDNLDLTVRRGRVERPGQRFGSAITDELGEALGRMRSLRILDISYSDLTPTCRDRLQQLNPNLRIIDTTPPTTR